MPTFTDKKVVINAIEAIKAGFTHTQVEVTKTATMGFGSMLVAAGTEAAKADAANVVMVIDDPSIDAVATGDTAVVSVAVRGCEFKAAALQFSDGALTNETLTKLEAKLCFAS
ncbi:hypothetical protein KUA24_89 [Vibrio phage HNL01]|nr:hypothetical protein KUA24_89 [Vibrio phage HNL01]